MLSAVVFPMNENNLPPEGAQSDPPTEVVIGIETPQLVTASVPKLIATMDPRSSR